MTTKTPHLLATATHDLPEEGQLVVYDAQGEKLIVLNEMGAAIYFLIDGTKTVPDISHFVQTSLAGGAPENCEAEVQTFVNLLVEHRVVEWRELPQAPG